MPGGRGASHNLFSHLSSARSATENRAYTHAFFLPKKRTRDDRPIRHALSPEWRKKEAQVLSAKNKVHLYFGCAKKAARYPCVCASGQFFLLFTLFCWPQKSEKRLSPPFPSSRVGGGGREQYYFLHATCLIRPGKRRRRRKKRAVAALLSPPLLPLLPSSISFSFCLAYSMNY